MKKVLLSIACFGTFLAIAALDKKIHSPDAHLITVLILLFIYIYLAENFYKSFKKYLRARQLSKIRKSYLITISKTYSIIDLCNGLALAILFNLLQNSY